MEKKPTQGRFFPDFAIAVKCHPDSLPSPCFGYNRHWI